MATINYNNPFLLEGYVPPDKNPDDVVQCLLNNVGTLLSQMKQTIKYVGTTRDTPSSRRLFLSHKQSVLEKLKKCQNLMYKTQSSKKQQQNELSKYTSEYRQLTTKGKNLFSKYKVYKQKPINSYDNITNNDDNETTPLIVKSINYTDYPNRNNNIKLQNQKQKQLLNIDKIYTTQEYLETQEQEVVDMLELLEDTKLMVQELDNIVESQDETINTLEDEVIQIKDNTKEATNNLRKARQRMIGSRKNLCIIFFFIIIIFIGAGYFIWNLVLKDEYHKYNSSHNNHHNHNHISNIIDKNINQ